MFGKKSQVGQTLVIVIGIFILAMLIVGIYLNFQTDFRIKKATMIITSKHSENNGDIALISYLRTPYETNLTDNVADLIVLSAANNDYSKLDKITHDIFRAVSEDNCYIVKAGEHGIKGSGEKCKYNIEITALLPSPKAGIVIDLKMKNEIKKK